MPYKERDSTDINRLSSNASNDFAVPQFPKADRASTGDHKAELVVMPHCLAPKS
jgi:hypothetical protein